MSEVGALNFKKLNDANYREWQFNIYMLLCERGLWGYVSEKDDEEIKLETEATVKEKQKYQIDSKRALATIVLSVEEKQKLLLTNCSNAKEAWKVLKENFEPISRARIAQLRVNLLNTKLEKNESMGVFISRVENAARLLTESGKEVNDDELAYQLIAYLPSEYESVVKSCYALDDRRFTTNNVKQQLLAEYDRLKVKELDNTNGPIEAFEVRHNENKYRQDVNNKYHFNGKCFRCNKFGHKSKDCSTNTRRGFPDKYKQSHVDRSPKGYSSFHIEVMNTDASSSDWIIDSGATNHICSQRNWFYNFRKMNQIAKLAEGETKLCGIGDINLRVFCGGRSTDITLKNVVYAPNVSRNLIAGRMFDLKGIKIVWENNKMLFYNRRNSKPYMIAKLENRFYILKCKVLIKGNITELNNIVNEVDLEHKMLGNEKGKEVTEFQLWHSRLGHVNERSLNKMISEKFIQGMKAKNYMLDDCSVCKMSKFTRVSYPVLERIRSKAPLDLIHSDLWGPAKCESIGGSKYFITFIDDFTRRAEIQFLRKKDEAFDAFKRFVVRAERQTGLKIRRIRTDNGLEYCNIKFNEYLNEKGIVHERTNTYSPQMNGVAERFNRTVLERVRSLLVESKLNDKFWAEAAYTSVYTYNRVLHTKLDSESPESKWRGRQVSLNHLKRFGCLVYVREYPRHSKFQRKAKMGVMVGYAISTRGYRIWLVDENRILETKHVKMQENVCAADVLKNLEKRQDSPENIWYNLKEVKIEVSDEDESSDEDERSDEEKEIVSTVDENPTQEIEENTSKEWTRIVKIRQKGKSKGQVDIYYKNEDGVVLRSKPDVERYYNQRNEKVDYSKFNFSKKEDQIEINMADIVIPKSYEETLESKEKVHWRNAMDDEIKNMIDRDVWTCESIEDKNVTVISSKWVYTIKKDENNKVKRFKARLVAQGFQQVSGVDYDEVFSPVVNFTLIRMFIQLFVCNLGWFHRQLDVKAAYSTDIF